MTTTTIRGRVRKFGDNIDTDTIAPGPFLYLPMDEMKTHAFGTIDPDFHKTVQEGDIIVAGQNFGCGSSREQATAVVKALGFRYIVCESMGRIYFRNCIALGLYPVMAEGASGICNEGDDIEIDLKAGQVTNGKTGQTALFQPLTGTPKEILDGGGIIPSLKKITENG
ncbi:MAG: 3-isopropylmalate dehydratase [Deltaproteobacteria bacterium]|nr:3-isopropylmalate dehydratase [Deltaproteobacteria bacterium]